MQLAVFVLVHFQDNHYKIRDRTDFRFSYHRDRATAAYEKDSAIADLVGCVSSRSCRVRC